MGLSPSPAGGGNPAGCLLPCLLVGGGLDGEEGPLVPVHDHTIGSHGAGQGGLGSGSRHGKTIADGR